MKKPWRRWATLAVFAGLSLLFRLFMYGSLGNPFYDGNCFQICFPPLSPNCRVPWSCCRGLPCCCGAVCGTASGTTPAAGVLGDPAESAGSGGTESRERLVPRFPAARLLLALGRAGLRKDGLGPGTADGGVARSIESGIGTLGRPPGDRVRPAFRTSPKLGVGDRVLPLCQPPGLAPGQRAMDRCPADEGRLVNGAGGGNRTLLSSLEGWSITTMLRPRGETGWTPAVTGLNIKWDWRSATPVEENGTDDHGLARTNGWRSSVCGP